MLTATRLLLARDNPFEVRSLAGRAVAAAGGADDAAALLEGMLAAPDAMICRALMALGDHAVGERLLRAFVVDGTLRDGAPEEVLHALGYLGVEAAEPVLWAAAHAADHYTHRNACIGLIDLPCTGRAAAIADAIRACHGRNLFGEFWPALAGKVGDPALVEPFIAAGAPTSTDCFGGVLLGLALLGERTRFERILFDPYWEAVDRSTGNRQWCALSVRILGLSVCALHRARRDALSDTDLDVLAALVSSHATQDAFAGLRAARAPADDDLAVYGEFFAHDSPLDATARRRRDGGDKALRMLGEARVALEERIALRLQREGTAAR